MGYWHPDDKTLFVAGVMAGEFDEDEKIEERIGKLNLIGGGNYEG